jgi:hypothetical protein
MYLRNINIFIKLFLCHVAYLHWATCHNTNHPSIERHRLFQNNNIITINNQILKHVSTHHLPLIVIKMVVF